MQADNTSDIQTSEEQLMFSLHKLSDAGAPIIQIRTREPLRAALTLRKNLLSDVDRADDAPYVEWDAVNGTRRFDKNTLANHCVTGVMQDFPDALGAPLARLREEGRGYIGGSSNVSRENDANAYNIHYFTFVSPQQFFGNPYVTELIQQYASILPSTNICLLFITDHEPLPGIPVGYTLVTEFPTPTATELEASARRTVAAALGGDDGESFFSDGSELTDQDYARLAAFGAGLTHYEFETYTSLALVEAGQARETSITFERLADGVAQGKTTVVRQSEILELSHPGSIDDVGGMAKLKEWLNKRADCFSDRAREFGVEAPKGIALVGVPGAGKSLIAKAVASVLQTPLVRFDFSRVFSKFVGDSESRVRSALRMVESMAPCVLFVDEIDKALGGTGSGGGDSGTTMRVLGSFLTWLQECKAPVFVMVTANRVDGLPPELLRRGRFDQIFSVGLPTPVERREVLAIHLRKRDRDIDEFTPAEVESFIRKSDRYVPAEIESAVKDALIDAFSEGEPLEMRHLLNALDNIVPLTRSNADAMARMIEWSANNAINVSNTPEEDAAAMRQTAKTPDARRVVVSRPRARRSA